MIFSPSRCECCYCHRLDDVWVIGEACSPAHEVSCKAERFVICHSFKKRIVQIMVEQKERKMIINKVKEKIFSFGPYLSHFVWEIIKRPKLARNHVTVGRDRKRIWEKRPYTLVCGDWRIPESCFFSANKVVFLLSSTWGKEGEIFLNFFTYPLLQC